MKEIRETTTQIQKDPIDYWVDLIQEDLNTIHDVSSVKGLVFNLRDNGMLKYFSLDNTGVFAYIISDDFLGGKCMSEVVFYIKKEHRGGRKAYEYIKKAESIALDNNCKSVKIGSNIGFKDESVIKLLKRLGYVDDTVSKYF